MSKLILIPEPGRGFAMQRRSVPRSTWPLPDDLCLRCLGILTDYLLAREAANYGVAGAKPQVIWPNDIRASTAIGLLRQTITPWHNAGRTAYLEYDGNTHTVETSNRLKVMQGKQQPVRYLCSCPHGRV